MKYKNGYYLKECFYCEKEIQLWSDHIITITIFKVLNDRIIKEINLYYGGRKRTMDVTGHIYIHNIITKDYKFYNSVEDILIEHPEMI